MKGGIDLEPNDVINEQNPRFTAVPIPAEISETEATRRLETADFEDMNRTVTVEVTEPSIDPAVRKSLDEIAERARSGAIWKDTPADPVKLVDEEVGHKAFVDTYVKPIDLINEQAVAVPALEQMTPAARDEAMSGLGASIAPNLKSLSVDPDDRFIRTERTVVEYKSIPDEPEPTPLNLDLIRRQAAELEKLWAALDAANHRINALEARLTNYNTRASHKI